MRGVRGRRGGGRLIFRWGHSRWGRKRLRFEIEFSIKQVKPNRKEEGEINYKPRRSSC